MKREPKTILDVVDQLVPGDNENRTSVDVASDAADVIEVAVEYARTKRAMEMAHELRTYLTPPRLDAASAYYAVAAAHTALCDRLHILASQLPDLPEEEQPQEEQDHA